MGACAEQMVLDICECMQNIINAFLICFSLDAMRIGTYNNNREGANEKTRTSEAFCQSGLAFET